MSISLLRSEVLHIGRNPEGLRFIWLALLDNAREPFYNLCDLISRGKSFCEPASTIQRKSAAGRLFASFAGILLNQEELPQNVAISFPDICAGLQTISERWSEYTSDELLSVALLLDLSGEGSVSYEDFLNFVNLANESLKQNPQKSRECFDTLYDCLTERIRGSLSGFLDNTDFPLETRLISLAKKSRINGLNPLSMLVKIKIQEDNLMNSVELFELFSNLGAVYYIDNEIKIEVKNGGEFQIHDINNNSVSNISKCNNNDRSYEYGCNDTASLFDFDNDIVCSGNESNDALIKEMEKQEMSPETNKSNENFDISSNNNLKPNGSIAGRIEDEKFCKKEEDNLQSVNEEEKKKLKHEENEIKKVQQKLLLMQEKYQQHQKQQQQHERNIEDRKSKIKSPVRSVRSEAIHERNMKNNYSLNNEKLHVGNCESSSGNTKNSKSRIPGPSPKGRKDDRVLNQSNLTESDMNNCRKNGTHNNRLKNQYNEDNNDNKNLNKNNYDDKNNNNSKNCNNNIANENNNNYLYDADNELLDPYHDHIKNESNKNNEQSNSNGLSSSSNAALVEHIQSLKDNVQILSSKLAEQADSFETSIEIWAILGKLEAQIKNSEKEKSLKNNEEKMNDNNENNKINTDTDISSTKLQKDTEGENNSKNPGKSKTLSRWMDSNSHFNPTVSSSSSTPCKSAVRAGLPALLTEFDTSEYDSFRSPSDYGNRSPMSPIILVNSLYSTSVIRHTLKSKSRSDTVLSPSNISVNSSISTATLSSISHNNKPNLKIFKSPLNRQLSPNYNLYDATNSTWMPTQYTNKYNHRFQSTADLIRGEKLNHMLQTDSNP